MTKDNFPYIALILGLILTAIVFKGSELRDDGNTLLPLLTLLLVSEFGAIVTAIGVYLGSKHYLSTREISGHTAVTILCAVLCVQFVIRGFNLWPHWIKRLYKTTCQPVIINSITAVRVNFFAHDPTSFHLSSPSHSSWSGVSFLFKITISIDQACIIFLHWYQLATIPRCADRKGVVVVPEFFGVSPHDKIFRIRCI